MTIEFTSWTLNAEVVLCDDIGTVRRFYMENVHLDFPGLVDAEHVYESLKELAPPPIIGGPYAHLHPLKTGKDERS